MMLAVMKTINLSDTFTRDGAIVTRLFLDIKRLTLLEQGGTMSGRRLEREERKSNCEVLRALSSHVTNRNNSDQGDTSEPQNYMQ